MQRVLGSGESMEQGLMVRRAKGPGESGAPAVLVQEEVARSVRQVTMLERALHPYVGVTTEVSRIKDEANFARETAAELVVDL